MRGLSLVPVSILIFSALASSSVSADPVGTPIHVGANVHVSAAQSSLNLGEVFIAADPLDANHLLACGIVYSEAESRRWTVVYLSNDRGKTWLPTLETKEWHDSADPACTLARDGVASHLAIEQTAAGRYGLTVYSSRDGGRTWAKNHDMPMEFQGIDAELSAADATNGKYEGSIYVVGSTRIPSLENAITSGLGFWRSRDGGRTFEHLIARAAGQHRYVLETGGTVVMRDGTVVTIFGDLLNFDVAPRRAVPAASSGHPNATLDIVTSTDGGDSMSPATKAADYYMAWVDQETSMSKPMLAVDNTVGIFSDRIYAVFGDVRSGRSAIYSIHSDDKGKTWSQPVQVDDAVATSSPVKAPNNFSPTIAVNRNGVVGVAWYDRRAFSNNDGWQERFAASLDGGDTWTPSVPVASAPNTYNHLEHLFTSFAFGSRDPEYGGLAASSGGRVSMNIGVQGRQFFAGDYAGLAADAGGVFHALWIDNRTGSAQVWTAPMTVASVASKFGSASLSGYADVSDNATLLVGESDWNRETNDVTMTFQLKNSGTEKLQGPFRLRVLAMQSEFAGVVQIEGAANALTGPGAVIDLDDAIPSGVLLQGAISSVKSLRFHLSKVWPLHLENNPLWIVRMDGQILAHRQ